MKLENPNEWERLAPRGWRGGSILSGKNLPQNREWCKKSVFSSDNIHDTSDVSERNVVRQGISDLDRMDFRNYIDGRTNHGGLVSEKLIAF